jgi:tRNA G18 (ribose-2'-O)-methylase SpoU
MTHKLTTEEMHRLSVEEFRASEKLPLTVVLDNVRSAYNVGSVFRSSDAFHADKVLLCGICALPPSAEIHKTALGAEEVVPWNHYADTLEAVRALKAEGYTVVAVEQTEHSVKLGSGAGDGRTALPCDGPCAKYAFIFGNEVEGVQQSVVDECDFALEIEQHGTKHSLNVAVTAGIVLFAAANRLKESV